ncbi:hypothetical protein VK792_02115 [Mesobacterium sp. TK19101]|uniref:Uncharacterized protein n=1 Tax=Mesobacterium hydrothermale TaxID=3111907 RepID=A0ABU6HC71_9RHOB|nr:hypothetical protein [Mesobacterium sp. TK19101]MEC3860069.1 hypothetical protein [Mesobacterium sp. TK19101]
MAKQVDIRSTPLRQPAAVEAQAGPGARFSGWKPDTVAQQRQGNAMDAQTSYLRTMFRTNLALRILVPAALAGWTGHYLAFNATNRIMAEIAARTSEITEQLESNAGPALDAVQKPTFHD